MHYKYSGMLNTAYVTMMYGGGMPILFPIAAAQLIVLYVIENYKFYRCYIQPPAYDEKLNKFCLNKLEKAPLLLLAFSYWIYSNHQIIQKEGEQMIPYQTTQDPFRAGHYWYEAFNLSDYFSAHAPPGSGQMLIMLEIYVIYLIVANPISYILGKCCGGWFLESLDINEDIDTYANCLDDDDK